MPSLFDKNKLHHDSYNVEIACPPHMGATQILSKKMTRKLRFVKWLKLGLQHDLTIEAANYTVIKKNEEIDVWFIGETHARTKYNLTRWVNKNHYEVLNTNGTQKP
ncbi:hypothetical protein Glove_749g3 [Diversispora epigaea]|uniref:Uncharacterized protein n=1 Tax=Diversispora epigaea TaxID=1348612 RepID=A0A397FZQ7_9GLOM|nr:hypothetical protein Glove_749g3 [Diversispora epigaea]